MKKVLLIIGIIIFFTSCQSYHFGVTYEKNEIGVFAGGVNGTMENTLFYFPVLKDNDMKALDEQGYTYDIGYDISFKYPFRFFNNVVGIYPMASFEARYSFFDSLFAFEDNRLTMGFKIGGGFEISFIPTMYLRGDIQYMPQFLSISSENNQGYRFSLSLGFRAKDDPLRVQLQRAKDTREREQRLATQRREAEKAEQQRVQNLQNAASRNPNSVDAQYELLKYYIAGGKNVTAAAQAEKIAQLDQNFINQENTNLSASSAADLGIQTSSAFTYGNHSIYFLLGKLYYDAAVSTATSDPEKAAPQPEKNSTLEKALAAFRTGFGLDITAGKNNNTNLRRMYHGYIAKINELLNRKDDQISAYIELAKVASLTNAAAAVMFSNFAITYEIHGRRTGNYTRQANGTWLYNGNVLAEPVVIYKTVGNAWIVRINGRSPNEFYARNRTTQTVASLRSTYNMTGFPTGFSEIHRGEFYLTEMYDIEVISIRTTSRGIEYSTEIWNSSDSLIFQILQMSERLRTLDTSSRPTLKLYEVYAEDNANGRISTGVRDPER